MTRSRLRASAWRTVATALLLAGTAACSPPKSDTTFLRSVDMVDVVQHMASSFPQAPAVRERSYDSPRWVISIDKVVNHTNQVIPDREKWIWVGRLRAILGQSKLSDDKNIGWIVPPEQWAMISEELRQYGEPPDLRRRPTHLMTAEFSALTNTSGEGRSDAYLLSFQLVELASGRIDWEDAWEVKRVATGKTYD